MPELFIYDASDINREKHRREDYRSPSNDFSQAIMLLKPPVPFLIRTLLGDYEYDDSRKIIIKNSFSNRTLNQLLSDVLSNGSDRVTNSKDLLDICRYSKDLPEDCLSCDAIWAFLEKYPHLANHYVFGDDGDPPSNRFSMIINSQLYHPSHESIFYQRDVELRRKALLGIIFSDTNPYRPQLPPMRFTLTLQNLEEVIAEIKRAGYFQPQS